MGQSGSCVQTTNSRKSLTSPPFSDISYIMTNGYVKNAELIEDLDEERVELLSKFPDCPYAMKRVECLTILIDDLIREEQEAEADYV